eukprot:325808-Chlamydomonas_euryale.AAC.1
MPRTDTGRRGRSKISRQLQAIQMQKCVGSATQHEAVFRRRGVGCAGMRGDTPGQSKPHPGRARMA